MQQLTEIPLGKIHPSPNNPRKHPGDLTELTASVKQKGVLEPVLVRPHPKKGADFELVAGERRWRAATAAELEAIPAIVRELSDDEALEVAIIENAMRADVHPLDEADGFALLVKRGRSPSSIAEKIGKPAAYVAQRLKLCELTKKCRKALDDEEITLAVAVLLARLPAQLQDEALEEVSARHGDAPMKAAEAQKEIESQFLLQIGRAPWDPTDAKLLPKAGACSTCPKRTGQQRELFADVKSPDLCIDGVCYRTKLGAHWGRVSKEAKASGQRVLSEKEAKGVFSQYGGEDANHGTGWKTLEQQVYSHKSGRHVKVRSLFGKDTPETVLARNPHTGAVHELVADSIVEKAQRIASPEGKKKVPQNAAVKKAQDRARLQSQVNAAAIAAAVDKAELLDTDKVLPWIVQGYARRAWNESQKAVITRRGLEPVKKKHYSGQTTDTEATLLKAVRVADAEGLRGFGLELALLGVAPGSWGSSPMWSEAMKALGVDVAKIEQQVKAEAKDKKTKGKKRAPAPAKPAKGKPKVKKRRAAAEASDGG